MVALAHAVPQGTRVGLVVPRDIRTASYLQRMDVLRRLPADTEVDGRFPEEQRTDCSGTLLEVSPLLPSTVQGLVNRVGRLTSEQLMTGVAGLAFRGAGELIDNAASHGHSQLGAFLCAQTYTGATSGRAGFEFAVCDTGIGVLAHLRGNPAYLGVPDSRTAPRLGTPARRIGDDGTARQRAERTCCSSRTRRRRRTPGHPQRSRRRECRAAGPHRARRLHRQHNRYHRDVGMAQGPVPMSTCTVLQSVQ